MVVIGMLAMTTSVFSCAYVSIAGILHQVLHSRERALPSGGGHHRQTDSLTRGTSAAIPVNSGTVVYGMTLDYIIVGAVMSRLFSS